MGWLELGLANGIVAVGATLQGSVGFGLGLFSVPLLVLVEPSLIPGPLLFASMSLTVLLAHRNRRGIDCRALKWSLSGRVVGVAAGITAIALVPRERMALTFGVLVLMAVGLSASGLHFRPKRWVLAWAGALSGFMGTTVSIGGPPMALVYQRASGTRIRGTLSAYFLVGVSMSLVGLHFVGLFGSREFVTALAIVPGILLGFAVSRFTVTLLDRGFIRPAVLAVSAATGAAVILRNLL